MTETSIVFGEHRLPLEAIVAIAEQHRPVALSRDPDFRARQEKGVAFLDRLLREDGVIYGVTTGYGDSCTVDIPPHLVEELPRHLTRFHGCGLGDTFTETEGRAILAARLASLSQGYSGVTLTLLEHLETFLNRGVTPVIPQEGSVGASGDLTPLSYVAAALIGERDVYYQGRIQPARDALDAIGLSPLPLRPKEGLALMNGTAVMTGLACLAWARAEYLTRLCARLTAMLSVALQGNANHFDERLFAAKPHPGQNRVAAWIRSDLPDHTLPRNSSRLQDRYSIRCAPHIIGVTADALPWLRDFIENELNSANDNPLIDGEGEHVLHGGHFYGGHIAFAMDSLKNAVANLADLMDRQLALLVDPKFNHGLPANLSGADADRAMINHGFKAVQIGVSAWTAEALKLTLPASVFSRSTECHNQDKVSMGTIAARDCLRVLTLTEQVAAAGLLAATQGLTLRQLQGELPDGELPAPLAVMMKQVAATSPFLDEDRPLEDELRRTVTRIRAREWPLYSDSEDA